MAPQSDPNLPPESRRSLRSRIVWLVVLASLVSALVPCLVWTAAAQRERRRDFDEAGPVVLDWIAERTRGRLEAARTEIERIALAQRAGRRVAEADLWAALEDSEIFSALLVLDGESNVLAVAGSGPDLEGLLSALDATSTAHAELMAVMQGAQLRRQLGSVDEVSIQLLETPDQPPMPVAGVALRDRKGAKVGALQGLLARGPLTEGLHGDLLGVRANVYLQDAEGRVVASREAGAEGEQASARAAGDFPSGLLVQLSQGWSLRYQAPLGALDWILVLEAPVLTVFHSLALALTLALMLPPMLALGFGALAFWSGTRLARPLWVLYASLRKVAREEDLSEVEPGSTSGESESLIEALNVTVRRLQHERLEVGRHQKALREQNEAFKKRDRNLSKLTVTDPLTQLANRRYFEEQLSLEIKRLSRHGRGLSMLVVDVDDFKKLNDTLGHSAGDEFLKQIARILKETVRATDLVARFGGEEFVVVAPGTNRDGAVILGEKVRTAVAEASFIVDDSMRPRRATISVGVAEFRGSQTDLFNSADAALYEAKSSGKNCVVAARSDKDADPD